MDYIPNFPQDLRRQIFVNLENVILAGENKVFENNIENFVPFVDAYYDKDDYIWTMIYEAAFGSPNPKNNAPREEYIKVKQMNSDERKKYADKYKMEKLKRKIYYTERLFGLSSIDQVKQLIQLGADIHLKVNDRYDKSYVQYLRSYGDPFRILKSLDAI